MNTTATNLTLLYKRLDADPPDRNLLLALADAEDEAGTGLGLGLQALAACGKVPWYWKDRGWGWWEGSWPHRVNPASILPCPWLRLCAQQEGCGWLMLGWVRVSSVGAHKAFLAAARAFNLLPAGRRDQLLRGELL